MGSVEEMEFLCDKLLLSSMTELKFSGYLSRPRRVATCYRQGCKNPRVRVAVVTKFLILAPNACASSVWTLLHVTVLASVILKRLLDFLKMCTPLL